MRFGPAAFHAAAPVFFTVTGTVYVPPAIIGGIAVTLTCATYGASAVMAIGFDGPIQVTPSFTSAKRSMYAPGVAGSTTVAVTVRAVVGATSAPSAVRTPSHRTAAVPVGSYQ